MNFLKPSMFTILSFIFFIASTNAQNAGKISGRVITNSEKTGDGATVSLLRAKDSATIKLSAANKEGDFMFDKVGGGKYIISITSVGYQKGYSATIEITPQQQAIQLPAIELVPAGKNLAAVTVTATRPLVEQRIDRTIVNVDASITNLGSSALEVLEKSPGITVDREGNISLKGKEGVLILVDGRPTHLSSVDLANLLRNMAANQMDQIEIMTNPPARYDAAGNAGIINIKTRKLINSGYNGSANFNYIQGQYPKTNEGINFNYRTKKINLFTNLSHNYRMGFETLTIQRNIRNGNTKALENYFDQESNKIVKGNSYNAKVGLDYFANTKTSLGIILNRTLSASDITNRNTTNILTPDRDIESITKATVDNDNEFKSFNTNLNFRTVLSLKRELTSDIDFVTHSSANEQFMVNSYPVSPDAAKKADSLQGRLPQNIHVYSARIDYLHPLKNNTRFEAGLKSSIVKTDNNASYDSIQYGMVVHDFNRSNHFIYEENINAAYLNLSTPLSKKVSAQFGLRLENTNAIGRQLTTGENFDRHYTQLFPTAYFQYKANDKNNFSANFGRRVRRPNYESLNPFIRFIDRYTYSQGNPNLKPQLSNNVEVSHTYRNLLTTTLNYTYTTDIINTVLEQKEHEAWVKPENIASLQQFGIAISSNTPVNKWWTSSININAFNNRFKGVVNNTAIDFAATSYVLNTTQQFKITKKLTGELSGRYRSGWLEGVIKAEPVGFLAAGLSQQIMKNNGTLRLTVRDIFYTQKFKAASSYGNVDFNFQEVSDSRVVVLGFTYRFSKGKKIAPTKRTAGSANEEQERIGN